LSDAPRARGDAWGPAWLLAALAFVATCGVLGLMEPTETRYAAIARAMRDGGDWLIPMLNGIPHFHKPPVPYWLAAAGMALLGPNAWGARLGAALAAGFTLWCTKRIAGAALGRGTPGGALAPLILASSLLFFALAHQLASDVFLAAAVAAFHAAWCSDRTRRGVWPWVALGVGFMIKGPVVLVPTVLVVLAAGAFSRDGGIVRPLGSARGWLLFLVLALPWYLYVALRTPGLLGYFLGNQLWDRYATTVHQRGGPVWYFIPVLLGGALPWTWAAAAGATRAGLRSRALLLSWVVVPLVFFSFSGSKLPAYVLPLLPAVAVLAAAGLDPPRALPRALTAITLALLAGGIVVGARVLLHEPGGAIGAGVPPAAYLSAAALALSAVLLAARRAGAGALLAVGGLALLVAAARPFDAELGSPRPLVERLLAERRDSEPVVEYRRFNAAVPFALGDTVRLLEVPRDDEWIAPAARARLEIPPEALTGMAMHAGRVWVVGPERATLDLALRVGLAGELRARWRGEALVALTPGP
jgi:4-amino-4-deoxy-L-arabinose transferase-like glycosyltransferase